jgi:transposase
VATYRDLLPGRVDKVRITAKDNRLFVEAMLYRYRVGISWRVPERFGDFRVIHTRHMRWSKQGVWQQGVFEVLAAEADNEYAQIDSTIVWAHQHSASAKKVIAPKNVSVATVEA